jgi:hypothetical protein
LNNFANGKIPVCSAIWASIGAEGGGVAVRAHVGFMGVILIKLFARSDRTMADSAQRWKPWRVGWE